MNKEKRVYRHHTVEEKLRVIEMYGQGYGCTTIGREFGVSSRQVSRWVARHRSHGPASFEKEFSSELSLEQKERIVRDVLEESLSCERASLKHRVSESVINSWLTKVSKSGYGSLSDIKKRGRPPKKRYGTT